MREDSLILPSTALERVKEANDLFRDIWLEVSKAADKQLTVRSLKKKTAYIEFCCGWGTSKFGYERSSDDLLTEFGRIDQVLGRMKVAGPPNSPPARSLDRPRPAPPLSFSNPDQSSTCTEISVDTVKVEIALEPQTQRAPEGINYN